MKRRDFIRSGALVATAGALGSGTVQSAMETNQTDRARPLTPRVDIVKKWNGWIEQEYAKLYRQLKGR